jgi:hypothetical protein
MALPGRSARELLRHVVRLECGCLIAVASPTPVGERVGYPQITQAGRNHLGLHRHVRGVSIVVVDSCWNACYIRGDEPRQRLDGP